MNRDIIITIVLSLLILISFDMISRKYAPPRQEKPAVSAPQTVSENKSPLPSGIIASTPLETPLDYNESTRYTLENNRIRLILSSRGACILEIFHKNYKDTGEQPFSLMRVPLASPGMFSLVASNQEENLTRTLFSALKESDNKIVFTHELPGAFRITKIFSLSPSSEVVDVTFSFENIAAHERSFSYQIVSGISIPADAQDMRYNEIVYWYNDQKKTSAVGKLLKTPLLLKGNVAWVAVKNKYFSTIVKPSAQTEELSSTILSSSEVRTNITLPLTIIPTQKTLTHNYKIYCGPNDYETIASYQLGNIDKSVSGGFIWFIGQLLLKAMQFLHRIVHNWGVVIILLTILLSLLLFPFSKKSLESMKKMQELQPKLEALKLQYKNDPQKLNRETMELWKKHKINPLAGCLPMIPQMLIFFALFTVLGNAISLKNASFLWIQDLSLPDRLFCLPFTIPLLGQYINLLPLLTIVVMFLQQLLSGAKTQDPQQKILAVLMPVMFGFIFYHFPSGCVLYFLTSTTMTILLQVMVMKK